MSDLKFCKRLIFSFHKNMYSWLINEERVSKEIKTNNNLMIFKNTHLLVFYGT